MESNEIRKAVSAHVTVAMFDFAKHWSGVGRDLQKESRFSKWLAKELFGILFGCPILITGDQS